MHNRVPYISYFQIKPKEGTGPYDLLSSVLDFIHCEGYWIKLTVMYGTGLHLLRRVLDKTYCNVRYGTSFIAKGTG